MHFKFITLLSLFTLLCSTAQAQTDFNYSFFPQPKYAQESRVQTLDSVTQKVLWKQDSTGTQLAVMVSKQGDELTLSDLYTTSLNRWHGKVKFLGLDGNLSLVYESQNEKKEIVVVNPVLGFVVIIFRNCEGNKFAKVVTDCDSVQHHFGSVPPAYKPQGPPTTDAKDKKE